MVNISSTRNFQYKIVKSIVLSILIPAAIILFSAWVFFGGVSVKPVISPTSPMTLDATNSTAKDLCKGMAKDKCNIDTCSWDTDQNMCFSSK